MKRSNFWSGGPREKMGRLSFPERGPVSVRSIEGIFTPRGVEAIFSGCSPANAFEGRPRNTSVGRLPSPPPPPVYLCREDIPGVKGKLTEAAE